MLHVAFVRSHLARAQIAAIDTSEALAAPGVKAVLTAERVNRHARGLQPAATGSSGVRSGGG